MSFVNDLGFLLQYVGSQPATWTNQIDISNHVETIDKFTLVGNGEIPTAKVMLDSREGEFVTNGTVVTGALTNATTPILKQYDYMRLQMEDDDKNKHLRIMIVDDIAPQKNESGTHVVVDLVGRERFLQKIFMTGYHPFISFKDILLRIAKQYNDTRGGWQPELQFLNTDLNALPSYVYGTFDFGTETTIYDALQEVVKRLTLPVAAGGAGEPYAIVERDILTSVIDTLVLRIVPRGGVGTTTPVASGAMNLTRVKSPESGNAVKVEGQEGAGSYPREVAEFRGLIEEYQNIPQYVATQAYPTGAYCTYQGQVFRAKQDLTAGTTPVLGTNWGVYSFAAYVVEYQNGRLGFGNVRSVYQYSPWTQDKSAVWKNWGGNITAAVGAGNGYGGPCFPDSNLVVRESSTNGTDSTTVWRDWVDFIVGSASAGRYGIASPYDGMRVLVRGTGTGTFAGNDEFNNPYTNAMVQYINGKWIVFRNPEQFDECCVLSEGKIYQFNTAATGSFATQNVANVNRAKRGQLWKYGSRKTRAASESADYTSTISGIQWRDISTTFMGNDVFHFPSSIRNVEGLVSSDVEDSRFTIGSQYTRNSAIEITYVHQLNDITKQLADIFSPLAAVLRFWNFVVSAGDTTDEVDNTNPIPTLTAEQKSKLANVDFYNDGWWCTLFEAPYPKSGQGISEDIGDLYKRGVFDLYNLNETPSGRIGYRADDADELGPWDGIGFWFKFNISGITLREFDGNIPFRCVIYDIFGGVWKSDFVIRFQDETQFIRIPFSSFNNYRSRLPVAFAISNWVQRAKNPELRETEIFNRYFLKRIVLHTLWAYDDQGRYDPLKWDAVIHRLVPSLAGSSADVTYTGTIDGFHFTRKPTAIAKANNALTNPTSIGKRMVMDKVKKYPHISNQIQLQKIASAELDISQHQEDVIEFQIDDQTDSIKPCTLTPEQTVRLKDQDFIASTEAQANGDERDYIVEKITYSVGDRSRGSGLVATIKGRRKLAT